MKKVIGWSVVGMLALGVVTTGVCAEPDVKAEKSIKVEAVAAPAPVGEFSTKTGVVAKVDIEAKTIVVNAGKVCTFMITADTKIVQGGAAKTMADVKVGDTVSVDAIKDAEGKRHTSRFEIVTPAPAK